MIQIVFSVAGATYCAMWTEDNMDNPYLVFNAGESNNRAKQDLVYNIMTMTGSWILIFW
jgi:hypothetical protein